MTYSLAELAIKQAERLGMHQEEERARWFDAITVGPSEFPTDRAFHVEPVRLYGLTERKPVASAAQVAHDLLEKECVKIGQGNILWFPDGNQPAMIVKNADIMRVVAWAELEGREISEKTAELLLAVLPCAYASRLAREAAERASLND